MISKARQGVAGPGLARLGKATRDPARYPGQFSKARRGRARLGVARLGKATTFSGGRYHRATFTQ
jgi:hypothetical protein